jgi:hypothetical protein
MVNLNKQLKELYASKWDVVIAALLEIENVEESMKPTNPYLLYIKDEDEWINADFRVMIFGQQTNNWHDSPCKNIEDVLKKYDVFFNDGSQSYGGQFWNGFYRFKDMLNKKYPDKKTCFLSNNIVKIEKRGKKGHQTSNVRDVEDKYFHVIPDEIRILQPNVLLFVTGPFYDNCVKKNFNGVVYSSIEPYKERQLAKLSIPDIDFAFRTYHPNYLWRTGINRYFDTIISQI